MVYLERRPLSPLRTFVESIWYAHAYNPGHRFERVFPNGRIQLIINLSGDTIANPMQGVQMASALVVGVHSKQMLIDTADLKEMIGVQFRPAGFHALFNQPANEFANLHVAIENVASHGIRGLRSRLLEAITAEGKLQILESELTAQVPKAKPIHPAVTCSLTKFARASRISQITNSLDISQRRFTQLFNEQVGTGPKNFYRIQRFQQALRQIRAGQDVRWASLALDCGYFDQSHFIHDFTGFSGITPGEYCARHSIWLNHVSA